jgi:copper resistance protein B
MMILVERTIISIVTFAAFSLAASAFSSAFAQESPIAQKRVVIPPPPESWPEPIEDNPIIGFLLFDQLEYRANEGPDTFNWEVDGWLGTDWNRLFLKTEGNQALDDDAGGEAEVELLYGRLVGPYTYFQVGGRYDQANGEGPDPSRGFGVIALQTFVPLRFNVEPSLYVSEDGDVSVALEAEYELFLTQRLVAQLRLETTIAAQEVEEFGVGSGFNNLDLGLRLRYEIRREFAPYVGLSWSRLFGNTADFAEEEGEEVDNLSLLAGVRVWF